MASFPQSVPTAIVLACEDPEAFRPLSYGFPPPLLPVRGIAVLERLLLGLSRCGTRRIVVIADRFFASLQQWLGTRSPAWTEISLAHRDQFVRAPQRLLESGSRADAGVLICGWNALWMERLPATALRPENDAEADADLLTLHVTTAADPTAPETDPVDREWVLSGIVTTLQTLASVMDVFNDPPEGEPPADWLGEVLRAAEECRYTVANRVVGGDELFVDSVLAYQQMNAGWCPDAPDEPDGRVVDPTAQIDPAASIEGVSYVGPRVVVDGTAVVRDCVLLGGSRVGSGSHIEGLLVGPGEVLPPQCRFSFAVVHRGEVVSLAARAGVARSGPRLRLGRRHILEHTSRMAGTRAPEAGQEDTDYDNRMVAAYTRWIRGSDSSRPGERLRACILPSGFQNKVCRVWREDLQGMSISHDGALEDATIVKWALRGEPLPLWVEHHSLRILDGQGIAPRAYCLDLRRDPFPYPVMVCECLPGSELASADLDAAMLTRIGRLLRRVHAQDGEAIWDALPRFPSYGFGDLRDYMADTVDMFRYYARYRQEVGLRDDTLMESMYHCVERLLRFVEDSVAAWEKWGSGGWPLKLCHGDPVPHNFLWDAPRQRLYLIDWERAGVGDPAYELAWFVALNHLDEAGEHALLAGYRQEAENQAASGTAEAASIDAQVERIHAYRKVTAMSWPIQILAYQARYWRERFPVTMTPHEYVAFNKREAYRRLADGFTYVGRAFGGWTATSRQLESMGSLLAMPD